MTRLLKTILPIILCALFGLSFASPTQAVASLPIVLPALTCDALSATDFSAAVGAKVTINHTEMQTSAQGSWCKVSATIAPEIGVQIALPTQRWSQRFLQVGCGGLCGSINLSLSNASGCLLGNERRVCGGSNRYGAPWQYDGCVMGRRSAKAHRFCLARQPPDRRAGQSGDADALPPAAKVCLLYGLLRRRSRSIDGSAALSAGF